MGALSEGGVQRSNPRDAALALLPTAPECLSESGRWDRIHGDHRRTARHGSIRLSGYDRRCSEA